MARLALKGRHRIICGDSRDPDVVRTLMDGELAAIVFTSPPYAQQRDYGAAKDVVTDWDALMRGVFSAILVRDDAQILVNLGLVHRANEWLPYWSEWIEWMRTQGWRRFGFYVWDQGPGLPGDWNGRLAPAHEFVFHFNRKSRKPNKTVPCKYAGEETHLRKDGSSTALRGKDGKVGEWLHKGRPTQDFRIPDSVFRVGRHKARGIEVEHPAVFPVALCEEALGTFSAEKEIAFEPFCGSGTMILAADRTGRRCFAVEMDPAYCDVAVRRWEIATGGRAVLASTGERFDEVQRG